MRCTRCGNEDVLAQATVKVSYVTQWRMHLGGGRYVTRDYADSCVRWALALCTGCAKQDARGGFLRQQDQARRFLKRSPLLILLWLAFGLVYFLSPLAVLGGIAMMVLTIIGVLLNVHKLAIIKRKLDRLEQGTLEWDARDRVAAFQAEADRILGMAEKRQRGWDAESFPLPTPVSSPRLPHPDAYTRQRNAFGAEVEPEDNQNAFASRVLKKWTRKPKKLDEFEAKKIDKYLFPVCSFGRLQYETDIIGLLMAHVRARPLNRASTRAVLEALANSGAEEAIPLFIETLERNERNLVAKGNAQVGLRRVTGRGMAVKLDESSTGSLEALYEKAFQEDAKQWRKWWDERQQLDK